MLAKLEPLFETHCIDCHSADNAKGGLNLERTTIDLTDAEVLRRWTYLHDRVAKGEMPPKAKYRPSTSTKAQMLATLADGLTKAHHANRQVVLRRLNRWEYEHTVSDLFGIKVDFENVIPDDTRTDGFDTTGSALSLSSEQMVILVDAADTVLDAAIGPLREPTPVRKKFNFKDAHGLRGAERILDDGAIMRTRDTIALRETAVRDHGTYRLSIQLRAVQADTPVRLEIKRGMSSRDGSRIAGFIEVPPGETVTRDLTVRVDTRFGVFGLTFLDGWPYSRVKSDYQGAGLFVGDIEMEGPLDEWPPASRRRLLGDADPRRGTVNDLRKTLTEFIPRAFRRPVEAAEIEPFVHLAAATLQGRDGLIGAVRLALKAVLCDPRFLFLDEPAQADGRLGNHALAARMSYFLWSSAPDEKLSSFANRGELSRPEILRKEIERMLKDPRSERLVRNFAGQWLKLRMIDFNLPDKKLYPEYDWLLRYSMLDESHAFFREILERDLSVQNFIDSDFVMINSALAELYGIEGVSGLEIRKVKLPPDSLRGGVLTQASVLKNSADGTQTSPVLRGAWILKHFFGTPSPPPPADIGIIEPDIRGATTIREQLAKHRADPSCSRCHNEIDPPGFALESFDVIGSQRDWYRVQGRIGKFLTKRRHPHVPGLTVAYKQGLDVDATGQMPNGRKFSDVRDYKRLLLEDETAMARSLTRLLLSYATGRELGFSDRAEVERIVAKVKANNYGLRSIIHEVIQSPTFQQP